MTAIACTVAGLRADQKRIRNLRRRVSRARKFPNNTCPSSRHVQIMADCLLSKGGYPMFTEEPEHCAESLLSVVESLWKARTELARLKGVAWLP